ncbi:MAG: ABC-F family ATP-binding cassette domain-containing protein [Proteobacteria bacterium]|nr:ABC-F family ATP-binding cassette domain-containing protein [Pseudomonadota bacterium]
MANLIQIVDGDKSFGPRLLLEKVRFSIDDNEHIGVIGPNGAGKTTLFKILVGLEELDKGSIIKRKGLRIGYLVQHDTWTPNETVEDYLKRGTSMPIWDAKALGKGLGISEDIYSKPIESLSGGYRMRCKLLHLLAEEPDLLLLDEPTNYLDLESVIVLESFLQGYQKTFLLISHDREFLRRTTDHILDVEAGDVVKYPGNLDDYFEQKALLREQLESRARSIEEKRQEVLAFVARFGAKANKASQAQSRLKSLSRLEKIEIKALPNSARIRIPAPTRTGKLVVSVDNADLGYGTKVILSGLNFNLQRGDHLGVVGVNGAGKSTFLKALAGQLSPLKGSVKLGLDVSIGYYAQHVSEALNPNHTVRVALGARAHPDINRQDILDMAGSLLFKSDDVEKPISVLSGGEKSRVALGQILLQRAPCLILDEPTNHLDFQTVEALTSALTNYEGTVITVSHDRSFIGRVGTKILEIRNGRAELYPGTYDEYVWSLQKGSMGTRSEALDSENNSKTPKPEKNNSNIIETSNTPIVSYEERKQFEKTLRKIESTITKIDAEVKNKTERMAELNRLLVEESKSPNTRQWVEEIGQLQIEISNSENEWLNLEEEKHNLEKLLSEIKNK